MDSSVGRPYNFAHRLFYTGNFSAPPISATELLPRQCAHSIRSLSAQIREREITASGICASESWRRQRASRYRRLLTVRRSELSLRHEQGKIFQRMGQLIIERLFLLKEQLD